MSHDSAGPDASKGRLIDGTTYAAVGLAAYLLASQLELFERFATWTQKHETFQVDEMIFPVVALIAWGIYQERRRGRRLLALLERQAMTDPLTGLPNRTLLMERVGLAAARGRRGVISALIFVDLDGFKNVNDQHGHDAGDQVLRAVAERLRSILRETDTVARLGGDEFVLLCDGVAGEPQVHRVLNRITEALEPPVWIGSDAVGIGASCGFTLIGGTKDVPSATELLRRADHAMYNAKRERSPD